MPDRMLFLNWLVHRPGFFWQSSQAVIAVQLFSLYFLWRSHIVSWWNPHNPQDVFLLQAQIYQRASPTNTHVFHICSLHQKKIPRVLHVLPIRDRSIHALQSPSRSYCWRSRRRRCRHRRRHRRGWRWCWWCWCWRWLASQDFMAQALQDCAAPLEGTFHEFFQENLVGGLEHFLFSRILGIIIPIDELIFFRGVAQPPTRRLFHTARSVLARDKSPTDHVGGFSCRPSDWIIPSCQPWMSKLWLISKGGTAQWVNMILHW